MEMQGIPDKNTLLGKLKASNPVWITWETQRRNKELANAFGCVFGHFDFSRLSSWRRYSKSAYETVRLVFNSRTKLVFTQCPSLVLCSLILLLRTFRKFTWVIDAHNAALEYSRSKNRLVAFVSMCCLKKANYVIVSNSVLCEPIRQIGGFPLILPDKLPQIPTHALPDRFRSLPRPILTLISTFAPDEPIEEFLKGALEVDRQCTLCITGKRAKARELLRYESDRIVFTDFLAEEDYEGLIQNSDLLIDLTTREDCLVCGAYEALAVGVPALLSDTRVLRELFQAGQVFSANQKESFRRCLVEFLDNMQRHKSEAQTGGEQFDLKWNDCFFEVIKQISA